MKYSLGLFALLSTTLFAGTWTDANFWNSTTYPRTDCELGFDETYVWTVRENRYPGKVIFLNPGKLIYPKPAPYTIAGTWVRGVATSKTSDTVYFGGDIGRVWKGVDSTFIRIADIPHQRVINDLAFDVYGKLWAATDSMVWRYDGSAWAVIGTPADYGVPTKTTHLAADPRGGMWIGSDGKGLLLYKQGAFRKEFPLVVRTLQVMPSGNVLVGRWGDMARIPYGSDTYEEIDDGPYSGSGWSEGVFEDANGGLWIGHPNKVTYRDPQGNMSVDSSLQANATTSFTSLMRFLLLKNGDFYACGDKATFKFSDKLPVQAMPTPDPEDSVPTRTYLAIEPELWSIQQQGAILEVQGKGNAHIQLNNVQGRVLWTMSISNTARFTLPKGVYMLQLENDSGLRQQKRLVVGK